MCALCAHEVGLAAAARRVVRRGAVWSCDCGMCDHAAGLVVAVLLGDCGSHGLVCPAHMAGRGALVPLGCVCSQGCVR